MFTLKREYDHICTKVLISSFRGGLSIVFFITDAFLLAKSKSCFYSQESEEIPAIKFPIFCLNVIYTCTQ